MLKEGELQRERDLNLLLQDEKYHALTKYEGQCEQNQGLNQECEHMLQDIEILKQRLDDVTREAEGLQRENQMLNRKGEDLT
jgi:hypothetical protein